MEDEFTIQIFESDISLEKLVQLKSIFCEYPGTSIVVIRIIKDLSDFSPSVLELKNIKVSPSIDLMLDLMEFMV